MSTSSKESPLRVPRISLDLEGVNLSELALEAEEADEEKGKGTPVGALSSETKHSKDNTKETKHMSKKEVILARKEKRSLSNLSLSFGGGGEVPNHPIAIYVSGYGYYTPSFYTEAKN